MRIYFVNFITPATEAHYDETFDRNGGEGADALIASQNRILVFNLGGLYVGMYRNRDNSTSNRFDIQSSVRGAPRGAPRGALRCKSVEEYIDKIQSSYEAHAGRPLFRYDVNSVDRWGTATTRRIPKIREIAMEPYERINARSMHNLFEEMASHHSNVADSTRVLLARRAKMYYDIVCYGASRYKFGNPADKGIATFKGTQFNLKDSYDKLSYKDNRQLVKLLGEKVAKAISTSELNELQEFIVDRMNGGKEIPRTAFKSVKARLKRAFNVDIGLSIADCNHFEYDGNMHELQGAHFCESCYDEHAVEIDGDMYHRDNVYYWESDGEYHLEPEPDDDDDDDDDSNQDTNGVMDYSTNVLNYLERDKSFIPSPYGELLMGIELEIGIGEDTSQSRAVQGIRRSLGEDYVVCKYDGSLPDDGIEIVTAPRKLDHHIKQFKAWEIPSGYRAWDAKKCGMHIHIDSRSFSRMTLGKFFMFFNADANADFIRKIAGRHPLHDNQAREFCAAEYQDILVNPSTAVKGKSTERYRIINTQNLTPMECKRLGMREQYGRYNTVELRIFRASLKKERLLAQIEFTHAVVMFCRVASWRNLNGESFVSWLSTTQNVYPHLSDWYGIRRKKATKPTTPVQDVCTDVPAPPETVTAEPRDVVRARGRL